MGDAPPDEALQVGAGAGLGFIGAKRGSVRAEKGG